MKKTVGLMFLIIMLLGVFASAGHAADNQPKLFLNGKQIETDVAPQMIRSYVHVPIAVVSSNMGYAVKWDQKLQKATIRKGGKIVEIKINDPIAIVDGEKVDMKTTAYLSNNRTMVPVRFVSEQLGLVVNWKQAAREVHITEKKVGAESSNNEPTSSENGSTTPVSIGNITNIEFDGTSALAIAYTGDAKPEQPYILQEEGKNRRIVIRFPNVNLTKEMFAKISESTGVAETAIDNNPLLKSYRYTLYSLNPAGTSLVLEVADNVGVHLTTDRNMLYYQIVPEGEAPSLPVIDESSEIGIGEQPIEQPSEQPGVTPSPTNPDGSKKYTVVIDAGHGGKDPGAGSITGKNEATFNLTIALLMQKLLEQQNNIELKMVRDTDVYYTLKERVEYAEKQKADIFISIHANSFTTPKANGTETHYYRSNSQEFAEIVHNHLLAATGLSDRGVKKTNYYVIKNTTMPAVLIESGFLSNAKDEEKLYDPAVQASIAEHLVAAINEYFMANP